MSVRNHPDFASAHHNEGSPPDPFGAIALSAIRHRGCSGERAVRRRIVADRIEIERAEA
jgi:hypothetical protein